MMEIDVRDRLKFKEIFKDLMRWRNGEVLGVLLIDVLQKRGVDGKMIRPLIKDALMNGIIYERTHGVYAYTDWDDELDWMRRNK